MFLVSWNWCRGLLGLHKALCAQGDNSELSRCSSQKDTIVWTTPRDEPLLKHILKPGLFHWWTSKQTQWLNRVRQLTTVYLYSIRALLVIFSCTNFNCITMRLLNTEPCNFSPNKLHGTNELPLFLLSPWICSSEFWATDVIALPMRTQFCYIMVAARFIGHSRHIYYL